MQSVFKYELNKNEYENIQTFCDSADYCSVEQQLGWTEMFFKSRVCYFWLLDESGILSYCKINEKLGSAQIIFGPVCCDKDIMVHSISEIIAFYKKRHFYYLGIQMYYKSGFETEYIEYKLNKLYNIHYKFDNENTKSSIEINLSDSEEDISSRIRKGHRNDIRKAVKSEVTVNPVMNEKEMDSFIEVYNKMIRVRRIDEDELSKEIINKIYNYLVANKIGEILIVKDKNAEVIGGAILVFQGLSVRYFKGTTDPDRREVPILHLLMYEAIKKAKKDNFRYFDFWGYNHFADEKDQVFNINHFKKGFGGYFTFFAKKMNIDLLPGGYAIYRLLIFFKNLAKI
jgi:lipid II:glycine glycyltransferase (peptidoglycan interpeptide bridge formation enzyme)